MQLTESSDWSTVEGVNGRSAELELVLGPFFAVTCLVEDSPALKNYYMTGDPDRRENYSSVVLQQRLSVCRVRR